MTQPARAPSAKEAPPAPEPRSPDLPPAPEAPSGGLRRVGLYFGRSLLPLVALVLILGTFLWGPWVTLGLTAAWWVIVTRIA